MNAFGKAFGKSFGSAWGFIENDQIKKDSEYSAKVRKHWDYLDDLNKNKNSDGIDRVDSLPLADIDTFIDKQELQSKVSAVKYKQAAIPYNLIAYPFHVEGKKSAINFDFMPRKIAPGSQREKHKTLQQQNEEAFLLLMMAMDDE